VTIPSAATAGASSSLTVTARSTSNTSIAPSATYTASAQAAQGGSFTLTPTAASLNSLPDTTVFFPVTLTNGGSASDSYALSVTSPHGWSTALYRDDNSDGIHQNTESTAVSGTGTLSAGSQYHFFVAMAIPKTVALGTQGVASLSAKAASTALTQSGSYTATAGQGTASGCSILPTTQTIGTPPGQKGYIWFSLTNTGSSQDSFTLAVTSSLGWATRVVADTNQDGVHQSTETTTLTSLGPLAPNAKKGAFVEVTVPSGATALAQTTATLKATSSLNPAKITQAAYTVVAQAQVAANDVDGDGKVTAADAACVAQIALGQGTWTAAQMAAADVNHDGVVNVRDIMQLLNTARSQPIAAVAPSQGDRKIGIPAVYAVPNGVVTLNLGVDKGTAVSAYQAQITLNTDLVGILQATRGALMGSDPNWVIFLHVDVGRLRVIAYNTAGASLVTGPGSVVQLNGLLNPAAQTGATTAVGWDSAVLSDASGAAFSPLSYTDGSVTAQ
jgi:hypothetical protein